MSSATSSLLALLAWCYTTRSAALPQNHLSSEVNGCKEFRHVFASEHDPRSIPDRGDLASG
jgi:hypothetical protein